MAEKNVELAPRGQQALETIRGRLAASQQRLAEVATKHLTPERLVRAVLAACSRSPELLECTTHSILQCVMIASQLGLEPNTPLGHYYLVPFRNKKTGLLEATPIIGYRGLVELARRSGKIVSVEAHVVHANDPHEVRFGMDAKLWHSPCLAGDPGAPLFAYAIATMEGGAKQAEVMTWAEILRIKGRSKAGSFGPWVDDVEEMAKKTVFRRLAKWLPLTVEAADALAAEDAPEGLPALSADAAVELPPALPPKKSRTAAVREAVTAAAPPPAAIDPEVRRDAEIAKQVASGKKIVVIDESGSAEHYDSETGDPFAGDPRQPLPEEMAQEALERIASAPDGDELNAVGAALSAAKLVGAPKQRLATAFRAKRAELEKVQAPAGEPGAEG